MRHFEEAANDPWRVDFDRQLANIEFGAGHLAPVPERLRRKRVICGALTHWKAPSHGAHLLRTSQTATVDASIGRKGAYDSCLGKDRSSRQSRHFAASAKIGFTFRSRNLTAPQNMVPTTALA